jgi:hypothetical protein
MKTAYYVALILMMLPCSFQLNAQGAIQGLNNSELTDESPSCGSHRFIQNFTNETQDFLGLSNALLLQVVEIVQEHQNSRNYEDLLVIPVVFHIVYNNDQENLADSVIFNQLEILNQAFRRQNENASQTRPMFLDLVGDTKIEFRLAEFDPFGSLTTGITRTFTDITHFGGVLPYASNQTNEINQWVNDSLYYNWFRLTNSNLGGIDAWDTERYINIWIGDLRIFEPLVNNFEELVFIGLATPPIDHENWPIELIEPIMAFEQGVLMHYVAIGDNNPNSFPSPYQNLNSPVKKGKVLVHELGHYLGLRHIWGDGDCTMDDFIADTPKANNHSNWGCNHNINSCVDDINDLDLPNMVENYMDYSSGNCQNSFTLGQADVMRAVLNKYRPLLAQTISTANLDDNDLSDTHFVFPNPFQSKIVIENISQFSTYTLYDLTGSIVALGTIDNKEIELGFLASGTYILEISNGLQIVYSRIIKQ